MGRTRVRRRRVALIVAVAVASGAWMGRLGHGNGISGMRSVASHGYVVRDGDSLWGIATRLQDGGDPRPLMDAIQSANHVDPGALRPGQTLVIPAI